MQAAEENVRMQTAVRATDRGKDRGTSLPEGTYRVNDPEAKERGPQQELLSGPYRKEPVAYHQDCRKDMEVTGQHRDRRKDMEVTVRRRD